MTIDWASLGEVAAVSFAAAFIVIALVSVALVGFSARAAGDGEPLSTPSGEHPGLGRGAGTVVGVVCVGAAALIVIYGLSTIAF